MVRDVRGKNYRRVMDEVTPALVSGAIAIIQQKQKFTVSDIGTLAFRYDLPIKTTCEFLEYARILPSGTWDRLVDRGVTAKKVRESASKTPE